MADTVLLVCSLGLNFLGAVGFGWKFYMDKTKNTTGKRETDFMDNALAAMEVLNTGDGLSSTLNDGSLILSQEAQQIQQKLYSLVSGTVALMGWKTLFERRATDASSLDLDIFTQVIRGDCQISTSELNSVQVPQIFKQIDTDKSGTVSLDEFLAWLAEDTEKTPKRLQGRLKRAMKGMDEATGWQAVFDSFDTDGSGELDLEEFIQAIRVNCGEEMARRDVWIPNEQLTALFKAADVDNRYAGPRV
jgi:Ca2+-binding EF-hand superfamily protein